MQPHPDSGFDSVAPFYDGLSRLVFGDALRQAQLIFLPAIPNQPRVLLIGGGSGWLLEQLLRLRPGMTVTYLEASSKMLQRARQRIAGKDSALPHRVIFRLGTEDALLPHEQFDVILTPFLLDLFPDERLQHLMDRLFDALTADGLWFFSDFWPAQTPPPLWQRLLLKIMYAFFGIISGVKATAIPDFARHFARFALQEEASNAFYGGMVQAKVFRKLA
ncbi:class I SAM-dependent methyltransferase [Pontibacter roseus]|uniref:class I SAM-dependent methyltransferase n=1 Tax=Pontibacter roseus TaxID=336989 RepID=UPI00035E8FC2|nr:class I SAM-dependent methyltransferase [Pontibacter roseus]